MRYAHQQYPWIVIYDDHETANNSWHDGAENHDSSTEGNWYDRKSDGIRAFEEWIPIREINDAANPNNHIHRTLPIGDLANIILLDGRLEGRDDPEGLDIDDQNKTMLGANQYTWLTNELYRSEYTNPVKWKFIGNQVMFAPLLIAGTVVNKDQWDGYRFERQKILNLIYGWGIKNTVILTGDIHTSWANDVPNQTIGPYGSNGQGSGSVEFVAPSITSPSTDIGGGLGASIIQSSNAHIKWVDLVNRGYYILDINKHRTQADWYLTSDITTHGGAYEYTGSIWYVNENESFLRQGAVPSTRLNPNPPLAPLYPLVTDIDKTKIGLFSILSINPNPFKDHFYIQFYSRSIGKLTIQVFSVSGTVIDQHIVNAGTFDLDQYQINTENYPSGTYFIRITDSKGYSETKKIIKSN
jgi:alkaline phosphatase D